MSNPLFNMLGGMNNNGLLGNVMSLLPQLKQNPFSFLQRAHLNVPTNISNPQQMIQHLMNTGQITQQQYEQARQMAQMFGNLK